MKQFLFILLGLLLFGGVGFLVYSYTPDFAHEEFDERFIEE